MPGSVGGTPPAGIKNSLLITFVGRYQEMGTKDLAADVGGLGILILWLKAVYESDPA